VDAVIFRRLAHTAISAATSAAILLTALLADAAPPAPAPRCAKATYIRADGAIVTRTVCVVAQSNSEVGK
jgi:hypothetical protein